MNSSNLIIEVPYYGLGDHLFHSHLPRIAKETNKFEKVFVSNKSFFRHQDNKRIVWELNPFVDGFVDKPGLKCDIQKLVEKVSAKMLIGESPENNLLDEIMLAFGLDDKNRYHDPEIFYKPKREKKYEKRIFDPNYFSYVGEINISDVSWYLRKNRIKIDAVMKKLSSKALHDYNKKRQYISTPNLESFCDLIYSCESLFCLTSGTATIASAMRKPAVVFWGQGQNLGFQHSKIHTYIKIEKSPVTKLKNTIKSPYRYIRYDLLNMQKDD